MRQTQRRAIARLLMGLLIVCIGSTAVANAAGLTLVASGSRVFVTGQQRCGTGPLTVSPFGTPNGSGQYTQVRVSGINGTCSVGGVAVIQSAAPYTVLFSAAGSVSGNAFTATSTAFTPPATAGGIALVSLDGWIVPATWSYTPPPPPPPPPPTGAISCRPASASVTATCTANVTAWTFWGTGYRVEFTITTTATTPFRWEVTLNLGAQRTPQLVSMGYPMFPGYPVPAGSYWQQWTPTGFTHSNLCTTTTNAQLPSVTLRGAFDWNRNVSASAPAGSGGFQANQSGGGALGTAGGIPTCAN